MKNVLKGLLALTIALGLSIPAHAQTIFSARGTATSTAATVTFSPANPAQVNFINDGSVPLFVAVNDVATAAAGSNRLVVNACESVALVSGGGIATVSVITAASTSTSYRVIAAYQRPNTSSQLLGTQDIGEQIVTRSNTGCQASPVSTVNGFQRVFFVNEELITLNTGGTTTDTSSTFLPANSVIEGVGCRVVTTITTAANWTAGDATTAARFIASTTNLTAGQTNVGTTMLNGNVSTTAAGPTQTSAAAMRITTNVAAGAGALRCAVTGYTIVPPTQ